jgi:hypothetical protein
MHLPVAFDERYGKADERGCPDERSEFTDD